ncbi:conserved hypothetical protein [Xenorhabdus bovienii str. Intermedium]|uniref:Bacteriophage P22 tailspike N-terminal domain-containing protein n=1 Tax=Xenorhabdus bovienii str. Intermedium TaxID=1379677 RepID=A0A077QE88_XENBV|nr:conserved hypothetical protein [Xenorhabdus bovienii str. Intermedium]
MLELTNITLVPSKLLTIGHSFNAYPNGNIYIGKIDADPTIPENQIQVYLECEDGVHIPVSQPLIINPAGYLVYNGQIAKFVTAQDHSMAVYDSCGVQQFYYPNVLKYEPDQFSEKLKDNGGDKLVGSSFGSSVYSDYSLCIFKRVGNFREGSVVKSKFDALLLDGKYYAYHLDVEHVVTEQENIQTSWVCVGLLNGYPVNDVRNFGAKADLGCVP